MQLARRLPGFAEEHRGQTEEEEAAHKTRWSKAEVVERAKARIDALEASRLNASVLKKVRLVRRQNRRLRDLFRSECGVGADLGERDFEALTVPQLKELLVQRKAANNGSHTPIQHGNC